MAFPRVRAEEISEHPTTNRYALADSTSYGLCTADRTQLDRFSDGLVCLPSIVWRLVSDPLGERDCIDRERSARTGLGRTSHCWWIALGAVAEGVVIIVKSQPDRLAALLVLPLIGGGSLPLDPWGSDSISPGLSYAPALSRRGGRGRIGVEPGGYRILSQIRRFEPQDTSMARRGSESVLRRSDRSLA